MKFSFAWVLALLHIGCVYSPEDTQAVEPKSVGDVRVMTWNILHKGWEKEGHASWKKRAPNAVRILREHRPDVVGLQEDSREQAAYIAGALPDYRYLDPHQKKGGGLLIRTAAWEVVQSGKILIPGQRRASWALLQSTRDGDRWLFYNAHLIHRTAPNSEAERMVAARRITEHMLRHAPKDVPVVFVGDFNALQDMPVMRYLSGEGDALLSFSNAFCLIYGSDDPRGTFRGLGQEHHGDRIDHILVNEHVNVLEAEIIYFDQLEGVYPSDHYPVQAALSIKSGRRVQGKGSEAL